MFLYSIIHTTEYDRFNNVHRLYGGKVYRNSQWLYEYKDTYVIIDLIEFTRSSGASPADIMLGYKRISHDEVNSFFKQAQQQQQENEKERNRDF